MRRVNDHSMLLYGEGDDDEKFLKYLRKVYAPHKAGVTFGNAHGGDPLHLVNSIKKKVGFDDFRKKLALFDSDRGNVQPAQAQLHNVGVQSVVSHQRIEVELLLVHGGATESQIRRARDSSSDAKTIFKEVCNCDFSMKSLERSFPKELLDAKRDSSPWLDSLIEFIES